jgi:hypothetical protein
MLLDYALMLIAMTVRNTDLDDTWLLRIAVG